MRNSNPFISFMVDAISSSHPALKLIFLLFGMFTCLFLANAVGAFLAIPVFSITWSEYSMALSDLENAGPSLVKYIQTIQSTGFFLLPGLLFPVLLFNPSEGNRVFEGNMRTPNYGSIFVMLLVSVPVVHLLVYLNSLIGFPDSLSGIESSLRELEAEANRITEILVVGHSPLEILINLLIVAVLPALGEELIFRRLFQRVLHNWLLNPHWAILISSVLFSAFHAQFYGFIPRLMLGMFFGYLYLWSGDIRTAIWAHFLNNVLALVLMNLALPAGDSMERNHLFMGIVLVSGILLVFLIMRYRKMNQVLASTQ